MANHSNSLDITWDVGVAIARTNPIPLDSTQNHASLTALQTYAKDGATSYVGQQVNVVSDAGVLDKAYIIKNKNGQIEYKLYDNGYCLSKLIHEQKGKIKKGECDE